jgi:hypothetical protein
MISTAKNLDKIKNKLHETKKRYYLINYSNSVVKSLFLFIALAALFFAFTPFLFEYTVYKNVIIVLVIASAVIVTFKYFLTPIIKRKSNDFFAILLEKVSPDINNLIINSIQLGELSAETVNKYGFSKSFIDLTVEEASEKIDEMSPKSAISLDPLKKNGIILSALFIAAAISFFSNPNFFKNTYTKFLYPEMFEEGEKVATVEEVKKKRLNLPEIGDFKIRYKYPAYSLLKDKIDEGSTGDVECLKGSQVEISAMSDRPLEGVSFVFNNTQTVAATLKSEVNFTYKFSVIESGVYHLKFKGVDYPEGFEHKLYEVAIKEDEFPFIKLTQPKEDYTVEENDTLKVAYETNDDYGIKEVNLVIERENGSVNVNVFSPSANVKERSGKYEYNLSLLDLVPGEVLKVYFEVYDTDTISGPKKSVSNERYFDVYSKEKREKEIAQMKERLFETLIDLLGDHFEKSLVNIDLKSVDAVTDNQSHINSKTADVIALIKEILNALKEEDMLEDFSYIPLDNMRINITDIYDRKKGFVDHMLSDSFNEKDVNDYVATLKFIKEEEIKETEQDILFLDNEKKKEKMNEIIKEGEELLEAEKDLIDLLEELKENGDMTDAKEKLEELLKKMDETFKKMMEKLAKFPQSMPDEFVNNESMKDMDIKDDMSLMEKLRESIENNDIEAALEQATEMLSSMNEMMSSFENSASEFSQNEMSDMLEDIDNAINKLDDLKNRQEGLMKDTKEMNKSAKEKRNNAQRKDLNEFIRQQQALIREIKKDIRDIQNELSLNPQPQPEKGAEEGKKDEEAEKTPPGVHGRRPVPRKDDKAMQKTQDIMRKLNSIPRMMTMDFNQAEKLAEGALQDTKDLKEDFNKEKLKERMKKPDSLQNAQAKAESAKEKEEQLLDAFGQFKQSTDSFLSKDEKDKLSEMAGEQEQLKNELEELSKSLGDKAGKNPALSMKAGKKPSPGKSQSPGKTPGQGKSPKPGKEGKGEAPGQGESPGQDGSPMAGGAPGQSPAPGQSGQGGQGLSESLEKAGSSMGKSQQAMGQGKSSRALPHQGDALSELSNAKANLEEMRKGMMKMGGQQAGMKPGSKPGGKGNGMPDRGRDDSSGGRGVNIQDIALPSAEEYTVPKEFREDILKGMKERTPKEYEEKVKGYYEELIK